MSSSTLVPSTLDVTTTGMLVPERIADAPTQRFYASSLFVFLQALKFYDYIQLYGATPAAETVFAIKWIGIDAAYLLLIPKLKIPWLSFGLVATFLQIALISVMNICLSTRIPISFASVGAALLKLVYDRELSVLENNVKISDIINNSSRILGRHTVNILPESTAKLNPLASCFCVGSKSKTLAKIPIRLNSTMPIIIQYSRLDPESNLLSDHNITGKELKALIKHSDFAKDSVWELPLTVSMPGLYRLERVQDSSSLDVRLYKSQAMVVQCPSASLMIPERLQTHPDRCTGDLDELSIRVSGLPPLRVKYNRWIEGRERVTTIDSVKPQSYTSPLMVGHHENPADNIEQSPISLNNINDFSWAKTSHVDVHLNSSLQQSGLWSYTIEEVEDGCGNTVSYINSGEDSRSHSPSPAAAQAILNIPKSSVEAPNYQFRVHERPSISFRGCSPENPTKLFESQDTKLQFEIVAQDSGPYDLVLGRGDLESSVSLSNESSLVSLFRTRLSTKKVTESVTSPGIYHIQEFASRHCKGIIKMPSSCRVYTPPKPSLSVVFEPIQDKCAGSIGLLADLSLTGTPPFEISWKVSKDGRAMQHRKRIDRARHQLRFTPEEAGHFAYEFTGLDDLNYKDLTLNAVQYRSEQTVYPLAGASFVTPEARKCCIGDRVDLQVRLVGSGPWQLVYEIIHSGARIRYEVEKINDAHLTITTPPLTAGGSHTVTLVSIEDVNGCRTPLEELDAKIEVRRERPSGAFYTIDDRRSVTIIEGSSVDLPLRLLGDGPWSLSYKGPSGERSAVIPNANGHITVQDPGLYQLQDIKDAYCPGKVDSGASTFEVSLFSRPDLGVPSESAEEVSPNLYTRPEVCEGDDDTFEVEVYGAPPFAITYERSHIGHKGIEEDKHVYEINAAQPIVGIKAKTTPPGLLRYTFRGISDVRYTFDKHTPWEPRIIEQYVNPRPRASFVQPDHVYNYCLEIDLSEQEADKIPLNFVGKAPFAARFKVKHELTGTTEYLTEVDIETHAWSLHLPKHMLTLGKHIVSLAEVSDANGCSRTLSEKDSQIFVAISEQPTILPVSSRREFCVGDRISYALQGAPPFKIEYDFNGNQKRATVNAPIFSRVAERPGEFSVLSISDSASKCKVNVSGLDKIIHDIPSVRVSEGKTIVESIHEGDQAEIIFHLYGTPPFSLTYTRSEISKGRHSRVLETHSVSGIWEEQYIIHSSVAGTFAATEIHDAHCRISLQP